ncbi:MAG: hypothetical protein JOY90_26890 [Bradyrhizobium sp.]|uniref:hypothetical protein n=1 Tax=Bradyrhizobium sp. TaxID=376 RepID=UPI001D3D6622|nr:hypothetical protein [Bradyrhizobium sp.]MBV9564042.1 hypothetical protein [Bradyrhizobium sp.]
MTSQAPTHDSMILEYGLSVIASLIVLLFALFLWIASIGRSYMGKQIVCPACNTTNTVGALRCENCKQNSVFMMRWTGRKLRATCSTCAQQDTRKKEIVGGLCTTCGHHLASEAAAAYGRQAVLPTERPLSSGAPASRGRQAWKQRSTD